MTLHSLEMEKISRRLRETCLQILTLVGAHGGKAFLVGGCVRDLFLGQKVTDIDLEVYGIESPDLESLLSRHHRIVGVGKSFGVFKLHGHAIDIALPRRESKTGPGHRGFIVEGDPRMDYAEAAARRDFTINSMLWDPLKNLLVDPFNGQQDLKQRKLRHTSDHFSEDPLRVLRGMQLAARFELNPCSETVGLCSTIETENLPRERIFDEWRKLLVRGRRPSIGLGFLSDCGWIRYYPELQALQGCEQDSEWHPEGDVWVHTLHCADAFARERIGDDWEDLVVGFAVICHDFGKPLTTRFERDHVRSPGHEAAGEGPTRSFLARITAQKDLIDSILPLVLHHLRPIQFFKSCAGDGAIRRLSRNVRRIDRLVRVARADMQGRPPRKIGDFEAGAWLLARAQALAVKDSAPQPIILGRHLIEHGEVPGPHFSAVLNECYEAQLDGEFDNLDAAKQFLQKVLTRRQDSQQL